MERKHIKKVFDLYLKSLGWDKSNPIQKAMYLRLIDATELIVKNCSIPDVLGRKAENNYWDSFIDSGLDENHIRTFKQSVQLVCEHCKSKSVTKGDGGLWCNDCRKLTKKAN